MNLFITPSHLKSLLKNGYSLEIYYLLKLIDSGIDLDEFFETAKLKALKQTIERKNLVSDGKLTALAHDIIVFVDDEESTTFVKKKPDEEGFKRWWETYPGTDTFVYNGRKFQGTRALRVKKEDCKAKIDKILAEGTYKIDDLIKALEIEIEQKKSNSIKTGQNKLSYMQQSITYLNQRTFEPYMELIKTESKPQTKSIIGGVNI